MATSTPDTEGASETDAEEALAVTVHLRAAPSSAAGRRQQSVLSTLRDLEAEGTIPGLTVERWSPQVTVPMPEEAGRDAGAVELFEEFETVAEESGIRLEPFFETRETVGGLLSSGPTNQQTLVFPVVCLTIRREGQLTGLYPCWNESVHQSVEDGLAALESGEGLENL